MKLWKTSVALLAAGVLATTACKRRADNSLNLAGSDTIVQLAQTMAAGYMKNNPNEKVSVRGGGSGTGIAALINGSTQIANASRKMKQKEWDKAKTAGVEVKEHIIGLDGIAVLVHPENKIKSLTISQLSDIYASKVTNWKDVGGADATITAISRENNSGTHVYFKEKVLRKGDKKSSLEFGAKVVYAVSSQQTIDQIKANKNAIGYVGMGWVVPGVQALHVAKDGGKPFAPNADNVTSGKYPIARTLQMYTNSKFDAKSKPFIDFVMSDAGQAIVAKLGFVKVK